MTTKRIEEFLKIYNLETGKQDNKSERALFCLLEGFKNDLPELDDYFHTAFRQIDVTPYGHVDSAIWHLLYDAPIFWECFKKVQHIPQNT